MKALLSAALALAFALPAAAADKPVLTVYTTESFSSEWGPGPKAKAAFEASHDATVTFVALDDGAALLSRLKLEGAAATADVVIGFDDKQLADAEASGLFAPHGLDLSGLKLPEPWTSASFVPFDYGWFAFVYDETRLPNPPKSLAELVDGPDDLKILIQDPRTSTPGLGLMLWVKAVYGDKAGEAWAKLAPKVLTVTKGWSEAYGLFTKGEAPMVLSYTTSPAYHIAVENETRYKAAAFAEGHVAQVEVAGKLKSADQPALADAFLAFLVSPAFQGIVPEGNWMYPVAPAGPLPAAFDGLVTPAKTLDIPAAEIDANRRAWVQEWLTGLSR